jgi:hypothetical protein
VLLAVFGLLCMLTAPRAEANTYGTWGLYGDRYWQVMANVINPLNGATYTTYGGTYVYVPHSGNYENRLQNSNAEGMSPHFYTLVGSLQRYDRGFAYWRYFNDEIRGYTQPSQPQAAWSVYGWRNPPTDNYWDYVSVSPPNTWNLCDAITHATDHAIGYVSRSISERQYYKTIRQ